jgi:hypothetical protein
VEKRGSSYGEKIITRVQKKWPDKASSATPGPVSVTHAEKDSTPADARKLPRPLRTRRMSGGHWDGADVGKWTCCQAAIEE